MTNPKLSTSTHIDHWLPAKGLPLASSSDCDLLQCLTAERVGERGPRRSLKLSRAPLSTHSCGGVTGQAPNRRMPRSDCREASWLAGASHIRFPGVQVRKRSA